MAADRWSIRRVGPQDDAAIAWIARGMRATLVEVEKSEAAGDLYTDEWRVARVRFHLDPALSTAAVWIVEAAAGGFAGHSFVRVETREDGSRYGLVSTTWVDPAHRREGIAAALLEEGERWFREQGLDEACTWTSSTNEKLIALYARAGYAEVERGPNDLTATIMVRLARRLDPVA